MNIKLFGRKELGVIFEAETPIDEFIINTIMENGVLELNSIGVKNVGQSFEEGRRSNATYVWRVKPSGSQ